MQIVISQWYDVVSAESAVNGDYDATGQDYQNFYYSLDEIDSACHDFEIMLKNMSYDEELKVGEVVYGVDADVDYGNGNSAFDRVVIDVISDDTMRSITEKRIRKQIQDFLNTI